MPIEELIQSRQQQYYDVLGISDNTADCTTFVKLMLKIIKDSLKEIQIVSQINPFSDQVSDPVKKLLITLNNEKLSISELMKRIKLTHKPTFRKNYLNPALEAKLIERTIPDKPNKRNQKYKKFKRKYFTSIIK